MTLEKHNMLYSVQYALAEFDETGKVSTRTMEMLGARAILLRYEIEGELASTIAKVKPKPVKAPDNVVPMRKKPVGRPRKTCTECGTRLTGKQRKFCSKKCAKQNWARNNQEKVKGHYQSFYERQKELGRA